MQFREVSWSLSVVLFKKPHTHTHTRKSHQNIYKISKTYLVIVSELKTVFPIKLLKLGCSDQLLCSDI